MEIKNRKVIVCQYYDIVPTFYKKDSIIKFPDLRRAFICPFDFALHEEFREYFFKTVKNPHEKPIQLKHLISFLEFHNAEELNYNEVNELVEG